MDKLQVSKRGQNVIASPIRKFLPLMQAAEGRGVKVFRLNVGDPDLAPPPEFMRVIKKYDEKTLGYAPSPGIKAHMAAWQKYYKQFGISLELNQNAAHGGLRRGYHAGAFGSGGFWRRNYCF